jgi:CRP-like cAMP-binding protein
MPQALDAADFLKRCAGLSMTRLRAGETILTSGSKTGRLLVLRSGSAEVVKDGAQIAKVSTPGAVFGELAVLLDQVPTSTPYLPPYSPDLNPIETAYTAFEDVPAQMCRAHRTRSWSPGRTIRTATRLAAAAADVPQRPTIEVWPAGDTSLAFQQV